MPSSSSLRQAASTVFAVTTVVPLLIFVWTLNTLDSLTRTGAQVGLCLALAVAILGYYIFHRLVAQMADSIAALGNALEKPGTLRAPAAPPAVNSRPAVTGSAPPAAGTAAPVAAPPVARADDAQQIPGLGEIQEVQDLNRAMATLWQNEAAAFKGRRVVISIVNSPRTITGTLVMLSHDGLLIQTDKQDHVPVGYSRIATIDLEVSSPS